MPQLRFESLTDSLSRLPGVIQSIPDIVRNPAANPLQAAILLGIGVVLLLIVLMSIVLVIMRPESEDEIYGTTSAGTTYVDEAERAEAEKNERVAQRMTRTTIAAIIIFVALGVLVAAGITTGSNEVCTSCHTDTVHDTAKTDDPHKSVHCVSCHETGGPVARSTVDVAGRVEHVILAQNKSDLAKIYGKQVSSDACARCHEQQISGVYVDRTRGVRVSHKEPLAAGAQCIDCHVLQSGVIIPTSVGMTSCLRCHDGKQAKSDCNVCHLGDPARGMVSIETTEMAAAQVPNPGCDGCHFDQTKCNNCHGLQMPHSVAFKMYAHARPAAIDIWFGTGKLCYKCHYPGHNYCVQPGCHAYELPGGHPNPAWAKLHQNTSWSAGPKTACSCHNWNPWDHNGMVYCQICHPVKPKNAIP